MLTTHWKQAEKNFYCKGKERVPLSRLSFGIPLSPHFVESALMGYLAPYAPI